MLELKPLSSALEQPIGWHSRYIFCASLRSTFLIITPSLQRNAYLVTWHKSGKNIVRSLDSFNNLIISSIK